MNARNVSGNLLVAVVIVMCGSARAADGVWDSASDGVWSIGANWQGGVPAGEGGAAVFRAASGAIAISNDTDEVALSGLTFNDGTGNDAAWTLNGLPLTLQAPATVDVRANAATLALAVGGTAGVVKTGAGAVRFAGGFTGSGGMTLGGGTLRVGGSAELGGGPLRIEDGTVAIMDEGEPGLMESASPNNSITLNTMGTNIAVCLTTRMANNEDGDIASRYPSTMQYIYTGRWHVPADAVYSFAKDFDDGGYLAIDGATIINNSTWSDFVVVRNVRLTQGWHDIDLRVSNGTGGVGPQKGLLSGIMYDATNGDFAEGNRTNAKIFRDDGNGATLRSARLVVLPQRVVLAGNATLDLSALDADFTPVLTGGCVTDPTAGTPVLTVTGGAGRLRVAGWGGHAPFGIEVSAPGGVILEGAVSLMSRPTLCGLVIVDGADIAVATPGVLGTGSLTLTNHSARLLSADALGTTGGDVTVAGTGNRIVFECAHVDTNGAWQADAEREITFSNNVLLAGANASVVFEGRGTNRLDATINGTGNLTKNGANLAELLQPCGFTGEVSVVDGRLVVHAPTVGNAGNTVRLNGGVLAFASSVEEASVALLVGAGGTLDIPAGQTVTAGEVRGTLTVTGGGEFRTVALGASVTVAGNVKLSVEAAVPDAAVTQAGLGSTLSLENGARVDTVTIAANAVGCVEGTGTVGTLAGAGTLVKTGEGTLSVVNASTFGGRISADAGKVVLDVARAVPAGVPAMWLDGAAPDVFTYTVKPGTEDPLALISEWRDCRANGIIAILDGTSGANTENRDRPYVMPGELNGLNVLSCGGFNNSPDYEFRRLVFPSVNARAVCMVFGSQKGGGHILGQTSNWDFQRNVESNNAKVTSADIAIWKAPINYPVWTNGVAVNGQETGLSGGWQVLSVGLPNGHTVNTLGMLNAWQNSGGQRYAEVLIYTNALTDTERRVNETYLAAKWGLGAFPMPAVSVAAGATLEVSGACQFAALTGAGTVVKTGPGALSFGGVFEGDLRIEGGTLALPTLPPPPEADAVLAAGNPLFWLDACETNRITFGLEPEKVKFWIDRRAGVNRLAYGFEGSSWYERPWLFTGIAPRGGGERFWIDFTTNPVYEASAHDKYMKIAWNQDPDTYVQDNPSGGTVDNIRTGFIVLDSSRGGGTPIGDWSGSNTGNFARDNAGDAASPVWGASTAAAVTNGETRLDGQQVDGRASGFNGGVQVLSFTTTGTTKFSGLAVSKSRYERLGELIFFDTVLSGNARDAVEAYLMNKWTDKTGAGYRLPGERVARHVTVGEGTMLDLTGAVGGEVGSVSGAGSVRVPSLGALPLISGGIGALEVTDGDCAFTVAKQNGVDVAQPTVAVMGTLIVPPTGVIRVTFEDRPAPGKITLITYGALAAPGLGEWTLVTGGEVPPGTKLRIVSDEKSAYLDLTASGTLLLLQ